MNFYNLNIDRPRAQTLQPIDKNDLLHKYLESLPRLGFEERTNYANISVDPIDNAVVLHGNPHSHHHSRQASFQSRPMNLHHHSKSHSQHYYHTMYSPDPNLYYNMPRPIQEPSRPLHNNLTEQFDTRRTMELCTVVNHPIDTNPPLPSPRKYSILRTPQGLFKVPFPQRRRMTKDWSEGRLKIGESIKVLGVSEDDRTKLTVSKAGVQINVPFHHTQAYPRSY